MRRAEGICSLFRVEELHPYLAAQVAYVGGYGWYQLGDREKTIRYLQEYARLCGLIFPAALRGDAFFDRIDPLDFRGWSWGPPRRGMKSSSAGGW